MDLDQALFAYWNKHKDDVYEIYKIEIGFIMGSASMYKLYGFVDDDWLGIFTESDETTFKERLLEE